MGSGAVTFSFGPASWNCDHGVIVYSDFDFRHLTADGMEPDEQDILEIDSVSTVPVFSHMGKRHCSVKSIHYTRSQDYIIVFGPQPPAYHKHVYLYLSQFIFNIDKTMLVYSTTPTNIAFDSYKPRRHKHSHKHIPHSCVCLSSPFELISFCIA